MRPLREHQKTALIKSCDRTFFALLMDRGTGKTKVAIETFIYLYHQDKIDAVLIIAPNDVHERWVTEHLPLDCSIPIMARVWRTSRSKKYESQLHDLFLPQDVLKLLSMNVEAFQSDRGANLAANYCKANPNNIIILDESTRIKTPGAKRTKRILKLKSKYRRILTGNEVTNTPFDLYTQMKFLNPSFWGGQNFFLFKQYYAEFSTQFARYKKLKSFTNCRTCKRLVQPKVIHIFDGVKFKCDLCNTYINIAEVNKSVQWEARKIKRNKGKYEFPVLKKYKNMNELREKVAPYSYRVKKSDCLDIPEKIYQPIYTELNPEQKRLYKSVKESLFAEYGGQELTIVNKLSLTLRFQQIVGGFFPETGQLIGKKNPKVERLLYDLEDVDNDAIIIWAVFRAEIEHLTRTLKKLGPCVAFYGSTKKSERRVIIDDFQKGKIRFLVANPDSAGTGLNLQRSCLHYYFSNSFKPEPRWQSEDRSHRDGQHWPVVYKDIFIKKTVDDTIQKAIKRKKSIAEFFRDQSLEDLV